MSLSYTTDNKLHDTVTRVLDEYREWFGRVVRRLFYPEVENIPVTVPQSFQIWKEEGGAGDLVHVHNDLHKAADMLLQAAAGEERPSYNVFDGFVDLYEEFIIQLRRLEKDSLHANLGMDALTGLRNRNVLEQDIERELERRARRGKPFCLVLAHIDNFETLAAELPVDKRHHIIVHVSLLIKKCLRSFDDAYRTGEGEFVMALKHADTAGGQAAINRLRGYLEDDPIKGEGLPHITMSYCTAEPIPGDVITEMLDNMRGDLRHYDEGGDTSVEYFEQSPLERFIKTMNEDATS